MTIAAKVASDKEKHPEDFCPVYRCLWRTHGGYCPNHEHFDRKHILSRPDEQAKAKKGGREISDTFDVEKWARATAKGLGHKPEDEEA